MGEFRTLGGKHGAFAASACMLLSFTILMVSMIWQTWMIRLNSDPSGVAYSIGLSLALYSSGDMDCECWTSKACNCIVSQQRNDYDKFNASICSSTSGIFINGTFNSFYKIIGSPTGWCKLGSNKASNQPLTILYEIMLVSTVMVGVAAIVGGISPYLESPTAARFAGLLAGTGSILSIAAVALAICNPYMSSFNTGKGGYLPMIDSQGRLTISNQLVLAYGPAFYFNMFAIICSLSSTMYICGVAIHLKPIIKPVTSTEMFLSC